MLHFSSQKLYEAHMYSEQRGSFSKVRESETRTKYGHGMYVDYQVTSESTRLKTAFFENRVYVHNLRTVHLHRTFIRNTLTDRKSRKSGTLYVCNRPRRLEVGLFNSYLKTQRSGGASIRKTFFF